MTRPNILWIQCDELRPDAIGAGYDYIPGGARGRGWPRPITPHLDALAKRGTQFVNTFCNSPVCVASRTSMLTGRYPHELGIYHNEAVRDGTSFPEQQLTWPAHFRDHGYATATIGKAHTPPGDPSWDSVVGHPSFKPFPPLDNVLRSVGGGNFLFAARFADDFTPWSTTVTNNALDWLNAQNDADPWLCRVSYVMPHTPVVAPKRFMEMFDIADFPRDHKLDMSAAATCGFEQDIADELRSDEMSDEDVAYARAAYWAVMAHIDDEIGRLFHQLDQLGQTENTIIVFDADHGAALCEMGLWQKQSHIPPVHRVNQIYAGPGIPSGETRDDLSDLLDRGPTLFDLASVPAPDAWPHGRSLFNQFQPAPDAIFSIIGYGNADSILYPLAKAGPITPRRACIRIATHRYDVNIRYNGHDLPTDHPDRNPALFDVNTDPDELHNLAGHPEHNAIEQELAAKLDTWLKADLTAPFPKA